MLTCNTIQIVVRFCASNYFAVSTLNYASVFFKYNFLATFCNLMNSVLDIFTRHFYSSLLQKI